MEKNIAALLRDDTKTVGVRFFKDNFQDKKYNPTLLDLESYTNLSDKTYLYVTTEVFKVGDYAVVFVNEIPKIALIARVDDTCLIDPQVDTEFKWIVSKVCMDTYHENKKKNDVILDIVSQAYKKNLKNQFQDIVMSSLDRKNKLLLKNILKR